MSMNTERKVGEPRGDDEQIKAPVWESPQVKHSAEALASVEPGETFWGVETTVAMLQDLGTESYLEDHDRPDRYTVARLSALFSDVKAECEKAISDIETGKRPQAVQEWDDLQALVSQLRGKRELAKRDENYDLAGELGGQIRDQERELSVKRQIVKLMGEDIDSLTFELQDDVRSQEVLARLESKAEQLEQLRRAASEMGTLGEHYHVFKEATSGIDETGKMSIIAGYGRLSATRMRELTSLPGLKPGLDFAFRTLLQLDYGKGVIINGKPRNRNLCADARGIRVENREGFRNDLIQETSSQLREQGVEDHRFLAREAVNMAFALHDVFFISMVMERPRNEKMELIDPDKERKPDPDVEGGGGSMHGLIFVDGTDKLVGAGAKLRKEALAGFPSSTMTAAISDMADRLIVDLLHGLTFGSRDDEKALHLTYQTEDRRTMFFEGNAFDFIESGTGGLSDVMGAIYENFHAVYLLGPFNATKVWADITEIPVEHITFLPDKLDQAYDAVRRLTTWAADFRKRTDKVLQRVYQDEKMARAESSRLLVNVISSVMRRILKSSVYEGGDWENQEALDAIKNSRDDVWTYAEDYLVHNSGTLVFHQLDIARILYDNEEVWTISHQDLIDNLWLKNALALRTEDEYVKEGDTVRKMILRKADEGRNRKEQKTARKEWQRMKDKFGV
ncbi:MAG: hypothetical protein R6U58_03560 [Bacteroidales bacterium]